MSTEHLESRHARARIFVKWLATKFLQEELKLTASTKTVIYDVAGGKGEIAFELCIRQKEMLTEDLQCIIIDPRKPNKFETGALPRWQKKMIKVKLKTMQLYDIFYHYSCLEGGRYTSSVPNSFKYKVLFSFRSLVITAMLRTILA